VRADSGAKERIALKFRPIKPPVPSTAADDALGDSRSAACPADTDRGVPKRHGDSSGGHSGCIPSVAGLARARIASAG
jgi:hypothetical protein